MDAKKYVESLKKKEETLASLLAEKENTIALLETELKSCQMPRPEAAIVVDLRQDDQGPARSREAARRLPVLTMDADGEEGWSHRNPESPGAEDASQACTACQSGIYTQLDEESVVNKMSELVASLAEREARLTSQSEHIKEMKGIIALYTAEHGALNRVESGSAGRAARFAKGFALSNSDVSDAAQDTHSELANADNSCCGDNGEESRKFELGWAERLHNAERAAALAVQRAQAEQEQHGERHRRALDEAREHSHEQGREQARELQCAVDALYCCADTLEMSFEAAAAAAADAVAKAWERVRQERGIGERLEAAARDAERRAAAVSAEAAEACAEESRLRKEEARAAARELTRQKRAWEEERSELEERVRTAQEAEARSKERAERCREESRKALDRAEDDIRRAQEREALLQARIDALSERQHGQVAAPFCTSKPGPECIAP